MIPPMKKIAATLGLSVALLTGCGSDEPTPAQERASMCEAFAGLTPGVLEIQKNTAVLADPGSTTADRSKALRQQLDVHAGNSRSHAYDCDLPSDQELFEEFVQTQKSRQSSEE